MCIYTLALMSCAQGSNPISVHISLGFDAAPCTRAKRNDDMIDCTVRLYALRWRRRCVCRFSCAFVLYVHVQRTATSLQRHPPTRPFHTPWVCTLLLILYFGRGCHSFFRYAQTRWCSHVEHTAFAHASLWYVMECMYTYATKMDGCIEGKSLIRTDWPSLRQQTRLLIVSSFITSYLTVCLPSPHRRSM